MPSRSTQKVRAHSGTHPPPGCLARVDSAPHIAVRRGSPDECASKGDRLEKTSATHPRDCRFCVPRLARSSGGHTRRDHAELPECLMALLTAQRWPVCVTGTERRTGLTPPDIADFIGAGWLALAICPGQAG